MRSLRRKAAPAPQKHPTDGGAPSAVPDGGKSAVPPSKSAVPPSKHPTDPSSSPDQSAVPGQDAPPPPETTQPKAIPSPGQDGSNSDNAVTNCPFCGSRLLTGRSDGSTECGYCEHTFKVMLVPQFAAMPLTVDGEPYDPEGAAPPDAVGEEGDTNGTDDTDDGDDGDDTDDGNDDKLPAFLRNSYRTSTGALLDREHYVTHLAVRLAQTPEEFAGVVSRAKRG